MLLQLSEFYLDGRLHNRYLWGDQISRLYSVFLPWEIQGRKNFRSEVNNAEQSKTI